MNAEEYLWYKRTLLKDTAEEETKKILRYGNREAVLEKAENAMQNLYILPGTGGKLFDVGNPPAWKECRVKDEEYLWGLARMPGVPVLTEAYILSGEKKYAEKALCDVLDFIDTCPPFALEHLDDPIYVNNCFASGTTNPWRQLEVGLRTEFSMRMLYCRLILTEVMTAQAHQKLAKSFYDHGRQLATVSSILWPDGAHNHFLSEMTGLLSVACLFPEFDTSAQWREQAMRGIEQCARAQITPCGAQIEGSPHYHNVCVNTLLDALKIAYGAGVSFSEEFMCRFRKMLEYSAMMLAPDGKNSAIGDSPHTLGLIPEIVGKLYEMNMRDTPLSQTAAIAGKSFDGYDAKEKEELVQQAVNVRGKINHYQDVGQVVGRTGFRHDDSWFTMICCTPVFNGHAHMDPMSVELNLQGRPILIDPSYYTYEEGEKRQRFKSADYHSCLLFGERMPYRYLNRWQYGEQNEGKTVKVYDENGVMAAEAYHMNYAPDLHKRLVCLFGKDTFVVIDRVENVTEEDVQIYFHLYDTELLPRTFGFEKDGLRILLPQDCTYEVILSERSLETDVALPSTRIRVTDTSRRKYAVYVTVFTVNRTVEKPQIDVCDDAIIFHIMRNGTMQTYPWKMENKK